MVIKMLQLSAGEFKTHCLKLMDLARDQRETILITKRGIPVAKLVPYDDAPLPVFGFMAGSFSIKGDILEPIPEKWDVEDDL
ncbi:type II toxin-antitoxin system Phd/YefM family antitoxin [Candidatus Finniella inopinata]|uniref:Antitoxin n=2 Tax=Candidatus Finniella inopinata TaxID=1696036 RepID=A0A4Q7DLX3_9PROT|nr:type II toxin-antitoxin system Phd/YefM family antitoxin [Candidatus Finniella inopinata]